MPKPKKLRCPVCQGQWKKEVQLCDHFFYEHVLPHRAEGEDDYAFRLRAQDRSRCFCGELVHGPTSYAWHCRQYGGLHAHYLAHVLGVEVNANA